MNNKHDTIKFTDTQLQIELYNLTRTLLARKYPLHIINHNKLKTLKFSRHDILHKTKKQNKPTIRHLRERLGTVKQN